MKLTYDLYAETNPSFCAANLASFALAHHSMRGIWPELIVTYFVLPLSLSVDVLQTFERTIKTTGLMVWLGRNPEIALEIAERVRATKGITQEAIRFGCYSGLLNLDSKTAQISLGENAKDPIKAGAKAGKDIERTIKISQRLGYWFGENGSSKSIYSAFGVTP